MWRSEFMGMGLWLFALTFIATSAVHLANRSALQDDGVPLRHGSLVVTADDAAYLTPAERWLRGEGWRTSQPGVAAYVGRSPGYGMIYAFLRLFFSPSAALEALFWLQVASFGIAVALVPYLLAAFGLFGWRALFPAIAAALWPACSSFLSYSLTEGVVPAMVVIVLALLVRRKAGQVLAGAALLGFLMLVRPPMLVWLVALAWALWPFALRNQGYFILAAFMLSILPTTWWQWHCYQKAGEVVGLHPIYHWDSNDLYRPTHQAVWGFHKAWGHSGDDFHRAINQMWVGAMECSDADQVVRVVVQSIPAHVASAVDSDSLLAAYGAFYRVLQAQAPYHEAGVAMPRQPDPMEVSAVQHFQRLRSVYQSAHPWHTHLGVPMRVYFFDMAAHSNLSLYIFQHSHRGKRWMEIFRWGSAGLHFGIFLLFPLAFIFGSRQKWWWPVAIPAVAYLFYLAFFQRGVEERYTLPVLLPMWWVVWMWLLERWAKWTRGAVRFGRKLRPSEP